MVPLVPRGSPANTRLDLIAASWGGLVASIGLLAGGERDWPARLAAGVIDALGGPDAPPLAAGGFSAWGVAGVWTLLWALLGGAAANAWLRPAGRGRVS